MDLSVGALGTELTQLTHDSSLVELPPHSTLPAGEVRAVLGVVGGSGEVEHCDWVSVVDQGDVGATERLLGVLAVGGRL